MVSELIWDFGKRLAEKVGAIYEITAYFDESGKFSSRSEYVAVGGCVFAKESIRTIHERWQARLAQDGLDFTSMKDALRFEGVYKPWRVGEDTDTTRRDRLLRDLAQLLANSPMLFVWATISCAEFEAFPSERKKRFSSPNYWAFQACMQGLMDLKIANQMVVQTVWDLSQEYSAATVEMFNLLRENHSLFKRAFPAITFCDDHHDHGLEMADMIAFCAREEKMSMRREPIVSELIETFRITGRTEATRCYTEGGIIGT